MGIPSSQEASQEDKEVVSRFLSTYIQSDEVYSHLPDAAAYVLNQSAQGSRGLPPHTIVKKYVLGNEEDSDRFRETIKMRKAMNSRYLPRIIDSYVNIDKGYCAVFYCYNVVFEFYDFNLQKELISRSQKSGSEKVS